MDPVAVNVYRGELVESVHRAAVAVTDPKGRLVASFGRPGLRSYLRSSAKPVQAVPLLESGAADRYGFGDKELAIACGSHNGEPSHTELVESMLERIGLDVSHLRCGRHAPLHKESAAAIGEKYSALHHNCSGKHAGMLAICVHRGWDLATYQSPEHPLQKEILRSLEQETGLRAENIPYAVDGCGVPTFGIPVRNAARLWARVAQPDAVKGPRRETLSRIRDAMSAQPSLVAGTDRLDTDLMLAKRGRLIIKAGAEAYYGAAVLDQGLGIAVKIEDGNPRAIGPALVSVLRQLGAIDESVLETTRKHWDEPVKNVVGRVVGRFEAVLSLRRAATTKSATMTPA